jgi:hypothetical protein
VLTEDCGPIIQLFEECHDEHPIAKFMGRCNDLKRELTLCLRAEVPPLLSSSVLTGVQRKMRQKINAAKAADKRKRIEAKWKEIDEQS